MTVGQMYEKINKFVNRSFPEAVDFSYRVITKEPKNYCTEIAVFFFDDSCTRILCNISTDRRRSIEVVKGLGKYFFV